ncbi:xaa-Arg dipeptidase-like isoform X2 [Sycon ciliatum]|uniref:xaa-Arg dipeptidase-like isoform X2 n=1 Tax=Sycon ciliatum TaxID=27933 RepID=UPI0031F68F66
MLEDGEFYSTLGSSIARTIDEYELQLTELSKSIWQRPELGYEEHFAHDVICSFLESTGRFQVERIAAGLGLQAVLASKAGYGKLKGNVVIIGTPAEEGGGGKVKLLAAHAFDNVDAAIMVHPSNHHTVRPRKLAQNFVTVTYTGEAAHGCRSPWDGINALDAAVSAYTGLSTLRQQMVPTWRVHAILAEGGADPAIVPEHAVLEAFARAPTIIELKVLKAKVHAIFQAAALATGCSVQVDWSSEEPAYYANLISNPTIANIFEEHFSAAGFVDGKSTAFGGSTDVGNVSYKIPSLQPMYDIDTSAKQHTRPFQEASNTSTAHQRTLAVAKAMATTGLELLLKPELLDQAKAELKLQLEGQMSHC